MRRLRFMLRLIGVVQLGLGLAFVLVPNRFATFQGLHPSPPGWVDWLFVMMGGRFLGYGVGMFVAARDPYRNRSWIDTMIAVQALDWIATIGYLVAGDVGLRNVTTAAFLPPLFIAALLTWHPRHWSGRPGAQSQPNAVTR